MPAILWVIRFVHLPPRWKVVTMTPSDVAMIAVTLLVGFVAARVGVQQQRTAHEAYLIEMRRMWEE